MVERCWYRYLTVIIIGLMAIGCSHDSDDGPSEEEIKSSSKVDIIFLSHSMGYEEPTPRMVASVDDWNYIELTNPDNPAVGIYYMVNQTTLSGYAIFTTDSTALICSCSPSKPTPDHTVLLAGFVGGDMRVALCDADWSSGTFTVSKETWVDGEETRAKADHDMDFIRESFDGLLTRMSKGIEKVGWAGNLAELPGVSAVADVWTKIAIPIGRYMLWEDNPERLKVVRDEFMLDVGRSLMVNAISSDNIRRCYYALRLAGADEVEIFKAAGRLWEKAGADVADEDIPDYTKDTQSLRWVRQLSDIARMSEPLQERFIDVRDVKKFRLEVSVLNTGETDVVVSGKYELQYGSNTSISQMGYIVKEEGGDEQTIDAWGLPETRITGLKPGTRYEVWAFVNSFFGHNTSTAKKFITDGLFKVSPTSLTFEADGGSQDITVEVGPEMTWEVGAKSDWCSVKRRKEGLTIKVDAAKEPRSSTVSLVATLANGTERTVNVSVSQKGPELPALTGEFSVVFSGTLKCYLCWRRDPSYGGDKVEDDELPAPAIFTVKDGKCFLTLSVGDGRLMANFSNWEFGSEPPALKGELKYERFEYSANEKISTIDADASFFHDVDGKLIRGRLELRVTISDLDTSSPRISSVMTYKKDDDVYDETIDAVYRYEGTGMKVPAAI